MDTEQITESLASDLREIADRKAAVSVTLHADGPYLVRGAFTILDEQGRELPPNRATVALCRCGRSRQKPFCDGAHKALRRWRDPAGAQPASCSPDVSRREERPAVQEEIR